jgi:glycosyltransferase involved in cell wall biosynthesis
LVAGAPSVAIKCAVDPSAKNGARRGGRPRARESGAPVSRKVGWMMITADNVQNAGSCPLVTIAIPTFNRAPLLKDCVISALAQTYRNFEVLVSDNASTDNSEEILRQFDDSRLRILRQRKNIGLIPNWNACLANARGEYIVVLPDDDRIAPWLLERCIGLIKEQKQIPVVITLCNVHSVSAGQTWPGGTSGKLPTGICSGVDALLEYLGDRINVAICSIMMRTDVVRAHGGFPLDFPYTADVATWAPLLFLGNAGFVDEACAVYYDHNNSETARAGIVQLLRDGQKMVALISDLANDCISDLARRRTVKLQARRCFARRGLVALSQYRRSGGTLRQIIDVVWQFRRELCAADVTAILRLAAIVLCPRPIVEQIRRLRPTVAERFATSA